MLTQMQNIGKGERASMLLVGLRNPNLAVNRPITLGGIFVSETQENHPYKVGVQRNKASHRANNLTCSKFRFLAPATKGELRNSFVGVQPSNLEISMNSILSLSDLNTTVNHEPRILDLRLGKALGFASPITIRKLIRRHMETLLRWGTVATVETVKRGQQATEYYLNKKQAIFLCTKSETEKANEVTIMIVEVYDAFLEGKLVPASLTKSQCGEIFQAMKEHNEKTAAAFPYLWSRFNNHFRLASYKDLPAVRFQEALEYIPTIPAKDVPAISAVSDDKLYLAYGKMAESGIYFSNIERQMKMFRDSLQEAYTALHDTAKERGIELGKPLPAKAITQKGH